MDEIKTPSITNADDDPNKPLPLSKDEIKRIAAQFAQSVSALKDLPVPIDNDTSGVPIFTEESIQESINELDIMLRTLFVRYGITRLMFTRQFNRYAVSLLHIAELKVNAQRENYLRSIKNGAITWPMFIKVSLAVLGMRLTRLMAEFAKFDGGKVSVDVQTDNLRAKSPETIADKHPYVIDESETKKAAKA